VIARASLARPLRMNQRILKRLDDAMAALDAAVDPADQWCTVEQPHREEMRLYLQTWALGPLRTAIAEIRGAPPSFLGSDFPKKKRHP
jgi:hypothetical protein